MRQGAEGELPELLARNDLEGPAFKMREDPRLTPLGRWLRVRSIDELPQLFNVLRGDMSLVGPRPPLAEEVAKYRRWQLRRLSMKPGITCTWQVSGRSNLDFDRWMALDLEYIDNWTLWLDVRLMIQTIPAVLRGTGAH
jgi:lipopolysaccharide/colanic/teichoic acid biosynthesis glycosyltransferase